MQRQTREKNQTKAADALHVTPKTLRAWQRAAWWQDRFKTDQGYDVEAIAKANPQSGLRAERSEIDSETRRLNREESALRLKLMELRLGEKSGDLVPLEDVIAAFHESNQALVNLILDIPIRAARMIPEGPLRTKMLVEGDTICRQALREIADSIRTHFEDRWGPEKKQASA